MLADLESGSGTAWTSALGPVGPTPHGAPLELSVECRTAKKRRGKPHPVTIEPDWRLTTPHDLEAERIGLAFGGYLTCVELADLVVPALRDQAQLLARRRLPSLYQPLPGKWRVRDIRPGCECEQTLFQGLLAAAEHARSSEHWVRRTPGLEMQLIELVSMVTNAHRGFAGPPRDAAESAMDRIREAFGVVELWRAGVPPEFVLEVSAAISSDREPLPLRLYQAAAYARPSHEWLADLMRASRDADVVAWAAWTESELDRTDPGARLQWLEIGLPRADVEQLMHAGYSVRDAAMVADASHRSVRRAAIQLAAWHRAGCEPGPGDLVALDRAGANEWFAPTAAAIDWVEAEVRRLQPRPTRTQIGLVLAVTGTTKEALRVLRRGVRDPYLAAVAATTKGTT